MQVIGIFATLTVMAAGASASPIEARQGHFPSAVGTINTYSDNSCRTLIAKNVSITDDCRALDEGIASIKYLSYDGAGIAWNLYGYSDTECKRWVSASATPMCTSEYLMVPSWTGNIRSIRMQYVVPL
ncbi:hypothetical protein PG995_010646 [Apiospora arundinis]